MKVARNIRTIAAATALALLGPAAVAQAGQPGRAGSGRHEATAKKHGYAGASASVRD